MMKNNKNKNEISIRSSAAEYLTYVAAVGNDKDSIEVRYEDENIWLTQKMLATVYGVNVATINEHIKNIYKDNELEEDSTIRKFLIVQKEGNREVSRNVAHYNLQMIIAIGFKVDNERAVQFRKWANQIVKDYTIKGWVIDDERLKNGGSILTEKYFEEQLERIREIRMSDRKNGISIFGFSRNASNETYSNDDGRLGRKIKWIFKIMGSRNITRQRKISAEMAKIHAETEFEKYRIVQDQIYISDFDELLLNTKRIEKNDKK